jgi:hypothetical protein
VRTATPLAESQASGRAAGKDQQPDHEPPKSRAGLRRLSGAPHGGREDPRALVARGEVPHEGVTGLDPVGVMGRVHSLARQRHGNPDLDVLGEILPVGRHEGLAQETTSLE